ncbi:MAG: hypothetical protein QGF00_11910 [Planctomycetota bacterium]|jgi:hypothetical protein|nr:hypothetical protein [Planctomycetota bacterium]MDP7250298.1 hypothetical protein [Planctomycetota bacterium]
MRPYEELKRLVDAFEEGSIDYALCGGLAVIVYGYARLTKAIDVLITRNDLDRVKDIAKACGFDIETGRLPFDIGTDREREVYRLVKIEADTLLMLDLVLVFPMLEDVWEDREQREWEGRKLKIVSPSGLVKMKLLAGRIQDLADLVNLGFISDEEARRQNSGEGGHVPQGD